MQNKAEITKKAEELAELVASKGLSEKLSAAWLARYTYAREQGGSEDEAAAFADEVVSGDNT